MANASLRLVIKHNKTVEQVLKNIDALSRFVENVETVDPNDNGQILARLDYIRCRVETLGL